MLRLPEAMESRARVLGTIVSGIGGIFRSYVVMLLGARVASFLITGRNGYSVRLWMSKTGRRRFSRWVERTCGVIRHDIGILDPDWATVAWLQAAPRYALGSADPP